MYKTRLLQNKELVIAYLAGLVMVVIIGLNLLILIPALKQVYQDNPNSKQQSPIDIEAVNKAIELLNH